MSRISSAKVIQIPHLTRDPSRQQELATTQSGNEDRARNPHQHAHDVRADHLSRPWSGDCCHYQAQIIGAELAAAHGRRRAKTSPRDAARAYGQTRRRPLQVKERPRLRTIM
ncbi:MAG: hypothetical protein N4A65_12360 [Cohaesibacter sp.]|nr:hypothetical protein [Cohaesibacter sp.]